MKKLCYSVILATSFLLVLCPNLLLAQKNLNYAAGSTSDPQKTNGVPSGDFGNYSIGIAQGSGFVVSNPSINPSDKFTLETWVYPLDFINGVSGNYTLIDHPSTNGQSQYFLKILNNNNGKYFVFHISNGNETYEIYSNTTVNSFQWYHVSCTFDGEGDYGEMKLYINGQLEATQSNVSFHSIFSDQSFPLRIGRAPFPQTYNNWIDYQYFIGSVSDIRLWHSVRSEGQISSAYHTALAVDDTVGLRAYWKGDNFGTNVVPDFTGHLNNDMQLRGSTWMHGFGFNSSQSESFTFDHSFYDGGTAQRYEEFTVNPVITNTDSEAWLEGMMKVLVNNNFMNPIYYYYYYSIAPNSFLQIKFKTLVPEYINSEGVNYIESHIYSVNKDKKINLKINVLDVQEMYSGNDIKMNVLRNGQLGYSPFSNGGFTIERTSNSEIGKFSNSVPLSSASGLWLGAKVDGQIKTSVADFNSEFSPGPIIDGVSADPNNPKYRVYKISSGDRAGMNRDYDEWPVDLGAPVTSQGLPKVYGDEMTWSVYNDMNAAKHFKKADAGVDSRLGAEITQIVSSINNGNSEIGNTFFIRYQISNKSDKPWTDAIAGIWSDIDLGNAYDDLIGSDSVRGMGYAYNSSGYDEGYGGTPPVLGYSILNSIESDLKVASVNIQLNSDYYPLRDPDSTYKVYNFLSGKMGTGEKYQDEKTGLTTKYLFSGVPEENTGFMDNYPADKRLLVSTEKFNLNPGESREFFVAINIVNSGSILNSIPKLRELSDKSTDFIRYYDDSEFKILAVKDIGNDQGKQVRVTWNRHPYDRMMNQKNSDNSGPDNYLASYSVWRKVDMKLSKKAMKVMSINNELYEEVGSTKAIQSPVYSLVVPTLKDSTMNSGLYLTKFKVLTHAAFSSEWLETLPDSGYSIDNLSPPPPVNIAGTKSGENVIMSWNKCEAADYSQTLIYQDINPIETLSDNLIAGKVSGNQFVMPYAIYKTGYYYRVVHQDFNGNKGNPSDNFQLVLTGIGDNQTPTEFALHQNYPNPFNPETKIKYDLPSTAFVSVEVYNILGELVQVLVNEMKPAGRYEVPFNSNGLSSTVYFCRMTAGNKVFARKMMIVK